MTHPRVGMSMKMVVTGSVGQRLRHGADATGFSYAESSPRTDSASLEASPQ